MTCSASDATVAPLPRCIGTMAERLARLRLDPSKIRIGIRRWVEPQWSVTLYSTKTGEMLIRAITASSMSLEQGVEWVLRWAERTGFDGVDLDMNWTYPAP